LQRLALEQPTPINPMPMGPTFIPTMESTTASQNSTTTQGLDKASQQRYQGALDTQQEAIGKRAELDTERAKQEALSKEELAALTGKQSIEQQALREQQKQIEAKANEDLKRSADEALKYEFDQNRVWKRMGTAGSITAGIGIALGALAQGFGAKSNAAIDVMDKNIQRDIEQQRMEYEKIKDKTRAQESAYGRLRQMGMDDRQAQESIHKAAMEKTRLGIEAGLLKTLGPEEAQAKSLEATAKAEESFAKAMESKFNKTSGSTTTTQRGMKAVGVGSLNPKERVDLIQSADKDEAIKTHKNAKTALGEFEANIDSRGIANPVAVASFISSTTGMNQGSYDPKNFNSAMTSLGFAPAAINKLRESFLGNKPLDPTITKNIQSLLHSKIKNTEAAAKRRFATTYRNLGLDEKDVLGGNVVKKSTAPKDNL
jgi:hypothetical protein